MANEAKYLFNLVLFLLLLSISKNYEFQKFDNTQSLNILFKIPNPKSIDIYNSNILAQNIKIINDVIDNVSFFNRSEINSNIKNYKEYLNFNNIISHYYYLKGEIEYFGLMTKKPNIVEGFKYYLVCSYFGNPQCLYKLYILFESNIINVILKSRYYKKLIEEYNNKLIFHYVIKTEFYQNFNFTDEYEQKSSANQMLYAASLSMDISSLTTLGYKYLKGIGFPYNCESARKYYQAASKEFLKEHIEKKKPTAFERVPLEYYEYIGHKFKKDPFEIEELIDYFKVEAENGSLDAIHQLGKIYLLGQGVNQDFSQALYYFTIGSRQNDDTSMYYLGEMYLNGWGVEKDFTKALSYLVTASLKNPKALNSLGYMYYYGLGVEKNVRRAYEYFKNSLSKSDDSEAYYNMAMLLIEDNKEIELDPNQAFKFLNFVSAQGHTFGTYLFGMMNQYKLGPVSTLCELNIEFFKAVSERSHSAKKKSDLAISAYRQGHYRTSSLLYLELAEEGHEIPIVNAAILFNKYDIFTDPNFNKQLAFKYFKIGSKTSQYAMLQLADFYYYGYGNVKKDFKKAYELYRKVVLFTKKTNFFISHAYFNLGLMRQLGKGVDRNYTKAMKFYNKSSEYEINSYYPSALMSFFAYYQDGLISELILSKISSIWTSFQPFSLLFCSVFGFVTFYLYFLISLKFQK